VRTRSYGFAAIVLSSFLIGERPQAQWELPTTDPRIKAEVVAGSHAVKTGEPIVVDVYIQNLERGDIQKRQFSPLSSMVGLPTFRIVQIPRREEILLSPGLFVETRDEWDNWYRPASGRDAYHVGFFVLPAGARVHLLHGDIRQMVLEAGEYCQRNLAEGRLLDRPESAATKKQYQDITRFARQFQGGGVYEVTVWAYAVSNTVTIQITPSMERPR
jgi:hypothetical protein